MYIVIFDVKLYRYLKIIYKGYYVEIFEEVEKEEVLKKVLVKLRW